MTPEFLNLQDRRLAYQCLSGDNDRPGIVFLSGYGSDMTGTKASFFADACLKANLAYLRFDYRGCGSSSGRFEDATLGQWLEDSLAIVDAKTKGPQILNASSMGGWIGLLLAKQRPQMIKALIGIAAAPDFTERLIWQKMTEDQRKYLLKAGVIKDPAAPPEMQVPITLKLVEEARQHLILDHPLELACKVHLIQGGLDRDVPMAFAFLIAKALVRKPVKITLIKDGDHRLNRLRDLDKVWSAVEAELIAA